MHCKRYAPSSLLLESAKAISINDPPFGQVVRCSTVGIGAVLKNDERHDRQRFIFLGSCKGLAAIVVVVAYPGERVKMIISVRKATKIERNFYEAQLWYKKGGVIHGPTRDKSHVEASLKEQQKALTSICLDADFVKVAKEKADKEGVGYLTWLN